MIESRLRVVVLLALGVGVLGVLLAQWPPAVSLEQSYGLDTMFKLRGKRPSPAGVCVVAIDDASYLERGIDPLDPWPRELHAELIRTLKAAGARAIAFDVLFEGPHDAAQDVQFELALFDTGNVVLGSTVERTEDPRFISARQIEPHRPFAESAAAVAEVALPTDRDGVIRRTWLVPEERPSLALAAYEIATGDDSYREEQGPRLIDYFGPPRTIETVSLYQALEPGRFLPQGYFEDRIVFVGLSQFAARQIGDSKDSFPTPFSGGQVGQTFGVEIHATVAANLLEGRRLTILPAWFESLLLLGLGALAALLFIYLRPISGAVALVGLTVVSWVVAYLVFSGTETSLLVVLPAFVQLPVAYTTGVVWYYLTTARQREKIRRAFSFYLSEEMIRRFSEDPDSLSLGGEEVVGTALFTDVKGFTAIAEGLSPTETAQMLNEYFSAITTEIFASDGTLIKYIGDAVFAIWGAPLPQEDHAARAAAAALAMNRFQLELGDRPAARLVTRIGIHSGSMLVGNLGSEQRFDYTAIGDTINLAARLESLNKTTGTLALISGESLAIAGDDCITRHLGRVRVVGREDPVVLHELLGIRGEAVPIDEETIRLFETGVAAYTERRLGEAETIFNEVCARRSGTDGPSQWYLGLIAGLEHDDGPWDGVVNLIKK